jgi:hypothetical protein
MAIIPQFLAERKRKISNALKQGQLRNVHYLMPNQGSGILLLESSVLDSMVA